MWMGNNRPRSAVGFRSEAVFKREAVFKKEVDFKREAVFKTDVGASRDCASGYCDACDTKMTLLGTLPAIRLRSAIHVFRCFACNSVISHEL